MGQATFFDETPVKRFCNAFHARLFYIRVAAKKEELPMSEQSRSPPTHFFTLRLWSEEAEEDEPIWRGRVQDTASGEVRYFQGWEALVEILLASMEEEN